jgi:hypothetical protein
VPQAAAPPRPRVVLRQGQNLPEVGLHQCPSERKGEEGPVRSLRVPSHVPNHPQDAAKVRGFSRIASPFTAETDWLLEGSGFEPTVPRYPDKVSSRREGAEQFAFAAGRLREIRARCSHSEFDELA